MTIDSSELLNSILFAAWKYDDKPHQMYNAIRLAAQAWLVDDLSVRDEIVRLMNIAYESRSARTDSETIASLRKSLSAMHRRAQRAESALAKCLSESRGGWESPERRVEASDRDRMMAAIRVAHEREDSQ